MNDFIKDLLKDKTIFIVSDLHMGDGSPRDNFKKHKQRFIDFLDYVEKIPNSAIVLAGDTLELWQCELGDVVKEYFGIIKRLIKMNAIFLIGNHDIDLHGFVNMPINELLGIPDLPMSFEISKCMAENIEFEREGQKFMIMHGHEFDVFNDPDKAIATGKILALLVGLMETSYGAENEKIDIEWRLRDIFEPFFRGLISMFTKLYKIFYATTVGNCIKNGKSLNEMYNNIFDFHYKYPESFLIFGHTHKKGWIENWCVNDGAWWIDNASYIKIDRDSNVELYSWPENKKLENQLR